MITSNGLIYTGWGAVPGIPARDLTPDEVEEFGGVDYLLQLGQWSAPEPEGDEPAGDIETSED